MAKKVLRSAEKFSEPFPPLSVTPLPLRNLFLVKWPVGAKERQKIAVERKTWPKQVQERKRQDSHPETSPPPCKSARQASVLERMLYYSLVRKGAEWKSPNFSNYRPEFAQKRSPNFPQNFEDFSYFVRWEKRHHKIKRRKIPTIFLKSPGRFKENIRKGFLRAGKAI